MKQRKELIFTMALCAIMAGLAIVLDKISLPLGSLKITFYALPLLVVGVVNGLIPGLIAGLVAGIVLQLTSPYGIGPTSVFWAFAPVAWGTISGLVATIFKKKNFTNKPLMVGIAVVCASICANLLNTFAMVMDSLLVKDSYYTMSKILIDWPLRILIMLVSMVPYIVLTYSSSEAINKAIFYKEQEEIIDNEKKPRQVSYMRACFFLAIFTVAVVIFILIDILVNTPKTYLIIFLVIDFLLALLSLIFSLRYMKLPLDNKDIKINFAGIILATTSIMLLVISTGLFIVYTEAAK